MKVYIGPYKNWIGPYQIADWLQIINLSEESYIKIGKFLSKTWLVPYQIKIINWLKKINISEEKCHEIGEYLSKTWLMKFCEKIHKLKKVKVKVKIHDYDLWSMDYTLSKIIYPMLKKMKEIKHGAPFVDDIDVPDGIGLRSNENPKKEDGYIDNGWFKRWDWVLDEMIWAFDQICNEKIDDNYEIEKEERDKYFDRIHTGLRLFGKYYMSLWD